MHLNIDKNIPLTEDLSLNKSELFLSLLKGIFVIHTHIDTHCRPNLSTSRTVYKDLATSRHVISRTVSCEIDVQYDLISILFS